jgi:alpha-mannosidase
LGGSSIAEAYVDARDQVGGAAATADTIITARCLDYLATLESHPLQRIAVFNLGCSEYDGLVRHEPWLHPNGFRRAFAGALLTDGDREVDYQIVQQSAMVGTTRGMIWEDHIGARGARIYRLDHSRHPSTIDSDLGSAEEGIYNRNFRILPGSESHLFQTVETEDQGPSLLSCLCSVAVFEDRSDTWSHRIDRFGGAEIGRFEMRSSRVEEDGPIRAALRVEAFHESSRLVARAYLYRNRKWIDVEIEITWSERFRVAKLIVPTMSAESTRIDRIARGDLVREQDGAERPFCDWTLDRSGFGVVSPDCFGFDGSANETRFTLVRSPVYAWHDPTPLDDPGGLRYTDQGTHRFLFRFVTHATPEDLTRHAEGLHKKPIAFDWTKGMPGF